MEKSFKVEPRNRSNIHIAMFVLGLSKADDVTVKWGGKLGYNLS